jgi:anti-sigma factor RsiW
LVAADDRPAAQLIYEDAAQGRIAIFLAANSSGEDSDFLVTAWGRLTACYWLDEQLGFVITGELSRDRIMAIARTVYRQFGD